MFRGSDNGDDGDDGGLKEAASLLHFCGRIMAPKDIYVLIPESHEYVTSHDKRASADCLGLLQIA